MDIEGAVVHAPDETLMAADWPAGHSADPTQHQATAVAERGQGVPHWMVTFGITVFAASAAAALASLHTALATERWPMLDLQVYRWAGLRVLHSGNLYNGEFPYHHLRFTYSPMAALVFAAASAVPMAALRWLITAGDICCLAGALWLTWGALGYRRPMSRLGVTLATAGVALWLQPVLQTLWLGQVNLMLMLVIVADLCLPDSARRKGIGVGLSAGFKLVPLIFIPYLLLTRRFRAAGVATATFALTIVGSLIVLPGPTWQFWFGGLFLDSHRTGNIAYVGNQSLHGTLARLLGGASVARPYWLALAAAVGAVGLLLAARWAQRGQEMLGIVTCGLTGLLTSPVSWAHHWVWAAPALVVAADLSVRRRATLSPSATPGNGGEPLPTWGRRGGGRRWVKWPAVAGLATAFFAPPEGLVPASVVQGAGAHGMQVLAGNLYVIVGLALLCVLGFALWARWRGRGLFFRWN